MSWIKGTRKDGLAIPRKLDFPYVLPGNCTDMALFVPSSDVLPVCSPMFSFIAGTLVWPTRIKPEWIALLLLITANFSLPLLKYFNG